MDSAYYEILSTGDTGYFLVAPIEEPYMNIAFMGTIKYVYHTDNKVFYHVRPVQFLHIAGFLGKYMHQRTFRMVDGARKARDRKLVFESLGDRASYADRINMGGYAFNVPAPFGHATEGGMVAASDDMDAQLLITIERLGTAIRQKQIIT